MIRILTPPHTIKNTPASTLGTVVPCAEFWKRGAGAVRRVDTAAVVPLLLTRAAVEAADGDTAGAIRTLGDALGVAERTTSEAEAGEAAAAAAEVWERLVDAYAELGRSADTKACSDEAARRLGRGHSTAAYCLGRHLETRDDAQGAQEAYTQVLAATPHLRAMERLGLLLAHQALTAAPSSGYASTVRLLHHPCTVSLFSLLVTHRMASHAVGSHAQEANQRVRGAATLIAARTPWRGNPDPLPWPRSVMGRSPAESIWISAQRRVAARSGYAAF